MVSLTQLWGPIVLSAILVFVTSSLIHMVFKWHAADYQNLTNEDDVRAVIRKGNPAPGQYHLPHCSDMKDMASPAMQAKFTEGPVALVTVMRNGVPNMGASLSTWFGFNLVISVFVAYLASRTLVPGTEYLKVFQVTSTIGFLAYAAGGVQGSIWMGKPWGATFKDLVDGLLYGCMMAGAFGWLWPKA